MSLRAGDSVVQTLTGNTSAGTGSFTTGAFAANTSTGNTIVIAVGDDSGSTNQVTVITDSAGNSYTRVTSVASTLSLSIWYCSNIKGGTTPTISVTYLSVSITNVSVTAQEFTGVWINSVANDKFASATGASTAPLSAATAITTRESELVVGCLGYTGAAGVATLGAGFSSLGNEVTNVTIRTAQESKVVAQSGAYTAGFTIPSAAWLCGVATFYGGFPSFKQKSMRPAPFKPGLAR